MKYQPAIIHEIYQAQAGHKALIEFAHGFNIAPGQYLQLWREADQSNLAETAFPAGLMAQNRLMLDHISEHWSPGDEIRAYGPLGSGFNLPTGAHNVLLVCMQGEIQRLLPLTELALSQGASVTVCIESDPKDDTVASLLPHAIEVQPLSVLPELLAWTDYMAIDLPIVQLPVLQAFLAGKSVSTALAECCQVLVRTPMPCADRADCGVCAIDTLHGPRLVCRDGPVFMLKDLIHVAG